jgi:hypothetical protein
LLQVKEQLVAMGLKAVEELGVLGMKVGTFIFV